MYDLVVNKVYENRNESCLKLFGSISQYDNITLNIYNNNHPAKHAS